MFVLALNTIFADFFDLTGPFDKCKESFEKMADMCIQKHLLTYMKFRSSTQNVLRAVSVHICICSGYRGDGSYSKRQFVNNTMSDKTAAVADGAAAVR